MLHGETVVLTDMLDCRERRARKQDEYREKYHTQTSHIENGKRSLKNQYFSSQNSFQAAL